MQGPPGLQSLHIFYAGSYDSLDLLQLRVLDKKKKMLLKGTVNELKYMTYIFCYLCLKYTHKIVLCFSICQGYFFKMYFLAVQQYGN